MRGYAFPAGWPEFLPGLQVSAWQLVPGALRGRGRCRAKAGHQARAEPEAELHPRHASSPMTAVSPAMVTVRDNDGDGQRGLRRGRYFTRGSCAGGCVGAMAYYTASGEPPGQWAGEGAAFLGLAGEVDPDVMENLYQKGIGPDGEMLLRPRVAEARPGP